jgi:hypothetical protein
MDVPHNRQIQRTNITTREIQVYDKENGISRIVYAHYSRMPVSGEL